MSEESQPTEGFPDVISPLEQMAIVTHETFMAFIMAGFKEQHALALTMKTLELSILDSQGYVYEELDLDEDE